MLAPPCRHLAEPDQRQRSAAPVAQLLPQPPRTPEEVGRFVEVAADELEVGEPRPRIRLALVAPDPLEVGEPILEQRASLPVVARRPDDVRPVDQDVAGGRPAGDVRERLERLLERDADPGASGSGRNISATLTSAGTDSSESSRAPNNPKLSAQSRSASAASPATQAAAPSEYALTASAGASRARAQGAGQARRSSQRLCRCRRRSPPRRGSGSFATPARDRRADARARAPPRPWADRSPRPPERNSIARQFGDPALEWRTIHFRAAVEISQQQRHRHCELLQAACSFGADTGLAPAEAVSAYSLGAAASVHGDAAEAERLCAESFGLFGALGTSNKSVPALVNVAEMFRPDPDAPGARIAFEDNLQQSRTSPAGRPPGYVLIDWANVVRSRGKSRAQARAQWARPLRWERPRPGGYVGAARQPRAQLSGHLDEAAQTWRRLREHLGDSRRRAGAGRARPGGGGKRGLGKSSRRPAAGSTNTGGRWGLVSTLWRIADLEDVRAGGERGRRSKSRRRLRSVGRDAAREVESGDGCKPRGARAAARWAKPAPESCSRARWEGWCSRRHAVGPNTFALASVLANATENRALGGLSLEQRGHARREGGTHDGVLAPVLGEATVQELRDGLRGEVLQAGDGGYDEARACGTAFTTARARRDRPRYGTADVIAALGFAAHKELAVAVRGGGHSVAGYTTCEGGIVIDLSPMKGRPRRPAGRIAYVGPRRHLGGPRPRDAGSSASRRPAASSRPPASPASRSAAASAG